MMEKRSAESGVLEDYLQSRDPRVLEKLLIQHTPLANAVAGRFTRSGEPIEDLRQQAMIGLLKALRRFDPSRDVRFSTFAWITVSGELKRYLRDRSWRMRVPRHLQDDHLEVRTATDDLRMELGREPTRAEVGARCGTDVEGVTRAVGVSGARRPGSLDVIGFGRPAAERLGVPDAGFERVEDRHVLDQLLARLPHRERRIIEMRCIDGLSYRDIAHRVGLSPVHVARLLARTLQELRSRQAAVAA